MGQPKTLRQTPPPFGFNDEPTIAQSRGRNGQHFCGQEPSGRPQPLIYSLGFSPLHFVNRIFPATENINPNAEFHLSTFFVIVSSLTSLLEIARPPSSAK